MAPPSRKDQKNFMAMVDSMIQNHMPCTCSQCKKSAQKVREFTAQKAGTPISPSIVKDLIGKVECEFLVDKHSHTCQDFDDLKQKFMSTRRPSPAPPKEPLAPKPIPSSSSNDDVPQQNRADKVNALLKAETQSQVFKVFENIQSTPAELELYTTMNKTVAQCKTYHDMRAKIIELCMGDNIDLEAAFGLVARFRQERGLLISAMTKSNSEREKSLQAIHRVDDLMCLLKDVAKDGIGSGGEKLRESLGNMIFEIHELAKAPSFLYDELLELREEHLDLLADHDDQHQKFLDIEQCHEKLHEKNKRLQEDYSSLNKDYLDLKKRMSALGGMKSQMSINEKNLEKQIADNNDLRKEVARMEAEMAKVNAVKHENTQLKKKIEALKAEVEAAKVEEPVKEKVPEPVQSNKKKKGKKVVEVVTEKLAPSEPKADTMPDAILEKELKTLRASSSEIQGALDTAQTNLRQLEVLLKKAELAKQKAIDRQQVEQATSQSWKELSEGHSEESSRLRIQLDESITNATTLQNTVHSLEQSLAEVKDQLKRKTEKRSESPSLVSASSSASKLDNESVRILRKAQGEAAQLVHDLGGAHTNYSGDPWNIVDCARQMISNIDQDLQSALITGTTPSNLRDNPSTDDAHAHQTPVMQSTYIPISLPRIREATPPTSSTRGTTLPAFRPLLPPGLADLNIGRSSPKPLHIPSPIGTGRPGHPLEKRSAGGMTPSPHITSAKTASFAESAKANNIAAAWPSSANGGIGTGAAGVDWSMWSKR